MLTTSRTARSTDLLNDKRKYSSSEVLLRYYRKEGYAGDLDQSFQVREFCRSAAEPQEAIEGSQKYRIPFQGFCIGHRSRTQIGAPEKADTSMYVCMYVCMQVSMYVCIYIYIHTYVYQECVYVCIYPLHKATLPPGSL